MPVSKLYVPDPQFPGLGADFADPVAAADFPETILRYRNQRAAASVGLETLTDAEWIAHFARFEPLPGNRARPLAMRYHGHQFRVYNPDLGDGRGFLFAQLREARTGRLLDLGTKGSGQTPWSRTGDGRLTLKGGVREVLATAMLEALGVPTSRSFSLIETGEALERSDEPSPTRSAVLTRLSHSHIRFGTFQRHAYLEQPDNLRRLVDHVIELYYPELGNAAPPARAGALLAEVAAAAAQLTAALDGRRLRARRAQHRQHEHHRRELRLRPLPLPAAQRSQLRRRLFRPDRPLQPSAASPRRCSGTCTSWPAP